MSKTPAPSEFIVDEEEWLAMRALIRAIHRLREAPDQETFEEEWWKMGDAHDAAKKYVDLASLWA